ncbi:MAG: protein translocase subunit SecD [Desulfohalobiaceae bacterium]
MGGRLLWRVAIAVLVLGLGVVYALPSFVSQESSLQKVLPDRQINLGLDLEGGISLILGVEMETAIQNSLDQLGDELRSRARDEEILVLSPTSLPEGRLQLLLLDPEQSQGLERIIQEDFSQQLRVQEVEELEEGRQRYTLQARDEYLQELREMTLDQALKVVRSRIDQFGVTEPDIRRMQDNQIQVQLPGLEDTERAVELVQQTAHLEFRLVDEDVDPGQAQEEDPPPGVELLQMQQRKPDGSYDERPMAVEKKVLFTGEHITDANVAFDNYNKPYVALSLDRQGSRIFERVTAENVQRRLAIVLDDKVYSAPSIRERISGGRASITGQFSTEEAHDLAIVLRAGSLPAPVEVLQQSSVGASLGEQSINQSLRSMLVGGLLVLLFTIVYYGFGGVIVDVLLGLNIVLILAVLTAFGATLTLPGIAGMILLIGIAVDSSVLIFERIREELSRGLSSRKAVDEGFSKATLTIVDANVTTLMAALILYQFGTGPIRGFAVTLSVGTLASMFTAIFVSRIFFDLWLKTKQPGSSLKL